MSTRSHRIAIVVSRFNEDITGGLLTGAKQLLSEKGIKTEQVEVFSAPGAFEIPLIAKTLAEKNRYAGIICLGAVIKGDTAHFEFISLGTTMGLMQAMLATNTPLSFGVLTTYTEEQAQTRSRADAENKGREAALACLESVELLRRLQEPTL